MLSADLYAVKKSAMGSKPREVPVLYRRTLVVNDLNAGNYNNVPVRWDLATISNSSQYIDWLQSYIQIPVRVEVSHTDRTDAFASQFTASLKNGDYCLIRSIDLKLSNMNVINLTEQVAARISYELVSRMDYDDAIRSDQFGYQFEDGRCFKYTDVASADGLGNCTTSVYDTAASADAEGSNFKPNLGRKKRCMKLSRPADYAGVSTTETLKSLGMSQRLPNVGTTQIYTYMCRIPFDILHDYFRKQPMLKSGLYDLSVQLNAPCSVACTLSDGVNTTIGHTNKTYKTCTVSQPFQDVLPLQLGSIRSGDSVGASMVVGNTALTAALEVCHKECAEQICTLHMSLCTLDPEVEGSYISNPVKEFTYKEHYVSHIRNVKGVDGIVNQLLPQTNISRMRSIVIMPYFAGKIMPAVGQTPSYTIPNALASPFDAFGSGYTSSPYATMTQFQVNISGQPVFAQPLTKTHQFYELWKQHTLNGGVFSADMNASLIDFEQYKTQYGAVVVPIRTIPGEDNLSKNITVQWQNTSPHDMNYLIFVEYEKSMAVDVQKGQVVL